MNRLLRVDAAVRQLRPLAEGRSFGTAAVTEPGAGSNVGGMRTTSHRDGEGFVLHGSKAWMSNLDVADFFASFTSFDRSLRHRGISAFIIPRDTPGLRLGPYHDKLGFRPLTTGDVVFDNLRLGPETLLGEEGQGFRAATPSSGAGWAWRGPAVRLAQACLDDAVGYARERQAFDRTIAELQIVQAKVCDMAVGVETARLLVDSAARAMDDGQRPRKLTSMAKMYASDVAFRSAADTFQSTVRTECPRSAGSAGSSGTPRSCRSSRAAMPPPHADRGDAARNPPRGVTAGIYRQGSAVAPRSGNRAAPGPPPRRRTRSR
ncbi:acyl-CoA dehydrogenase family protein [Streptomyces sp. GbtcB7]|uniref:acyl-CoA dehydrogenase family protein n=1 Tax=Streptomyces sp. GbtcB7 TaxID=2824752 RepID=UPI001C30DDAF|nr:acyl-CoA dehydrogenase family protein [Streptomyces sp. GbtcB7]